MTDTHALTIGELSRRTGCKVETIRYYEKAGLLAEPPRSAGNYRLYANAHVLRIGFIRRCRELGFPLTAITTLLEIAEDAGSHTRAEVKRLVTEHLNDVASKIADLERLRSALEDMSRHCDGTGGTAHECPILEALAQSPVEPPGAAAQN